MITEGYIMQLKAACDIVSIISSYVPLKQNGRNRKCLCPFHLEKTPSFVVYEDTQSFYCYGCGAGGDVITFIMRIENLEYLEALKLLAERVGLPLPENERDDQQAKLRQRLLELNRQAARYFHSVLKGPDGKSARDYFAQRRLSAKTIVRYGLGYAPDSWNALRNTFQKQGYSYEEMVQADLIVRSKSGSYYDKFRNRVIFPILDLRGNVIAFGGRVLDDQTPKYVNTSDTLVFQKKRNLFSLNFAKNSREKTLILAEGYMDVIAMHQAGFTGAVATLGTALTSEQARLISRYADDVVIAYDSDEAGQKATSRASKLFGAAGVTARVLRLYGAKDPDEFIKKYGSGKFQILLKNAGTVTQTQTERLKEQYDLERPEEKRKYLLEYCAMIAQMSDALERQVYIGQLALECGVSREAIELQVRHMIRAQRKRQQKQMQQISGDRLRIRDKVNPDGEKYPRAARAEEGILHFMMANPDFYYYITELLSPDDFKTKWNRQIYERICERLQQNLTIDFVGFHDQFSADEISRFSRILNNGGQIASTQESLDDCIAVLKAAREKMSPEDILSLTPQQLEEKRLETAKQKK